MRITWVNNHIKAANMHALGKRISKHYVDEWAEEVAEDGEESFNYSVISGGKNQTKKGGPRIETERMINSIGEAVKAAAGSATVIAGFGVGGKRTPKWTTYQEHGTYEQRTRGTGKGVPPMLAVPEAIINMEVAADNSGRRMLKKISKDWHTTV